MIKTYGNKRTEKFFTEEDGSDLPPDIWRRTYTTLVGLDEATRLIDIQNIPGFRLEKLKGDLKGMFSVRINKQWRIIFQWKDGDVYQVEIVDYHWGVVMKNVLKQKKENPFGPVHPGEFLKTYFLDELGMSNYALAQALHVPPIQISEIVRGLRAVTPRTALRFARYFGTTPELWLNLQRRYDLEKEKKRSWAFIEKEIVPHR